MESYAHLLKFLIVGNAGTGKTCILHRFVDGKFREDTMHTIGVEFGPKIIQIDGKSVKLQIWDTAGQDRFQCVTRSYYRGAAGALVVYDITDRQSFAAIDTWVSSVRDGALPNVSIILIGNKADLANTSREVTESEGRRYAEDNGIGIFLETSAKEGRNVTEAFLSTARDILSKDFAQRHTEPFAIGTHSGSINFASSKASSGTRCC